VLTDSGTADGFRLSGVATVVADSPEMTRVQLNALIDDESSGIIAVNERLMAGIDERTQLRIDAIYRPIVISMPIKEMLEVGDEHRAYLARLIRRAIGFDITLRRG